MRQRCTAAGDRTADGAFLTGLWDGADVVYAWKIACEIPQHTAKRVISPTVQGRVLRDRESASGQEDSGYRDDIVRDGRSGGERLAA